MWNVQRKALGDIRRLLDDTEDGNDSDMVRLCYRISLGSVWRLPKSRL